jgi:hypothetical protein|tara:strand:- start:287 stop:907 length:621 start_codon:yes stop_codon:yes gene_type:complete
MADALTAWIAVTLWLMVASWTYKDNPLFKIATVASVAGGAANGVLVNINNVMQKAIVPILDGSKILLIIPILIGIMFVGVFDQRFKWLARIPTVTMMGISMGAMLTGVMSAQIIGQVSATASSLVSGSSLVGTINALIVLVATVTAILYFTYSKEQTGIYGNLTTLGRYFLLASLGPYWAGELGFHMAFGIKFVQIILDALATIGF